MSELAIHFVRVTFEAVSAQEMGLLLDEDERLNDLFNDRLTVEYDGFERGDEDFVMYFYGMDAERMTSLIVPELKNLPCSDRAVLMRRHGDHGAREETIKLT